MIVKKESKQDSIFIIRGSIAVKMVFNSWFCRRKDSL
nr:MAG TPA: hypothetical protein [Caudoviricetes sp.]